MFSSKLVGQLFYGQTGYAAQLRLVCLRRRARRSVLGIKIGLLAVDWSGLERQITDSYHRPIFCRALLRFASFEEIFKF
jgi:hypothetical protein